MNTDHRHIDRRALGIYSLLALAPIAILVQMFYLQLWKGNYYRRLAHQYSIRTKSIRAERGNIFSHDDKLLAISVPKYNIRFDAVSPPGKIFRTEVQGLAQGLAEILGGTTGRWLQKLVRARKRGNQYLFVANDVSFKDFMQIKKLPLFRHGKFKGGLIYSVTSTREYPFKDMLRRTVGINSPTIKYGLEASYDKYLSGQDGKRLMQKISGAEWKPINNFNEKEPVPGYDIVSSVDMRFQDIAYGELLQQLNRYHADHGTVVIMEVHTGKIRAIVNLGRNAKGHYYEKRNYAVAERYEPGSVFKTFTFLTHLEDGKVSTKTRFRLDGNKWKYMDRTITDAHGNEAVDYSLEDALAHSSNIATVQMTDRNYRQDPKAFVDGLFRLGIGRKTGIDIPGEASPLVPYPGTKEWKAYKLGMMAFGYGVELTPLQILSVYNAIANDGKLVRPSLTEKIIDGRRIIKTIEPEIIDRSIASRQSLDTIRQFLRAVVTRGTATNVNSPYVKIAGKTGTTQTQYWTRDIQYIASFAGFFPYEHPQYSMIVVIHKPDKSIGYYGNAVAGTVFRKIAEQINGMLPDTVYIAQKTESQ